MFVQADLPVYTKANMFLQQGLCGKSTVLTDFIDTPDYLLLTLSVEHSNSASKRRSKRRFSAASRKRSGKLISIAQRDGSPAGVIFASVKFSFLCLAYIDKVQTLAIGTERGVIILYYDYTQNRAEQVGSIFLGQVESIFVSPEKLLYCDIVQPKSGAGMVYEVRAEFAFRRDFEALIFNHTPLGSSQCELIRVFVGLSKCKAFPEKDSESTEAARLLTIDGGNIFLVKFEDRESSEIYRLKKGSSETGYRGWEWLWSITGELGEILGITPLPPSIAPNTASCTSLLNDTKGEPPPLLLVSSVKGVIDCSKNVYMLPEWEEHDDLPSLNRIQVLQKNSRAVLATIQTGRIVTYVWSPAEDNNSCTML